MTPRRTCSIHSRFELILSMTPPLHYNISTSPDTCHPSRGSVRLQWKTFMRPFRVIGSRRRDLPSTSPWRRLLYTTNGSNCPREPCQSRNHRRPFYRGRHSSPLPRQPRLPYPSPSSHLHLNNAKRLIPSTIRLCGLYWQTGFWAKIRKATNGRHGETILPSRHSADIHLPSTPPHLSGLFDLYHLRASRHRPSCKARSSRKARRRLSTRCDPLRLFRTSLAWPRARLSLGHSGV